MEDILEEQRIRHAKIFEALGMSIIEIHLGKELLCIADKEQDKNIMKEIATLRLNFDKEFGIVVPKIGIKEKPLLLQNQYIIKYRDITRINNFVEEAKMKNKESINELINAVIRDLKTVLKKQT